MKNLIEKSDVVFGELPRLSGAKLNGRAMSFSFMDADDPIKVAHAQAQYFEAIGCWGMAEWLRAEVLRMSGERAG